MEAKGDKAWKPAQRERKVSTALEAYAAFTTSAARGAARGGQGRGQGRGAKAAIDSSTRELRRHRGFRRRRLGSCIIIVN